MTSSPMGRAPVSSGSAGELGRATVFLLFFLSGGLGLLYEVVWLRLLILVFGSTQFAIGTILTSFMAGLALGSWLLGRVADRVRSPLRAYGLLELGIGLYALLVPRLFDALAPLYGLIWRSFSPDFVVFSLVRFACVAAVLVLPTTLMGGTLPILSRFVARREESIGVSVGALYAINTLGAVAGTASTGFLLLPALGTSATSLIAAGANLAVGAAALILSAAGGGRAPAVAAAPAGILAAASRPAVPPEARLLLWIAAGSGFVAMIYEVAWTRVLALVIGSSVYAFTIMLTTFLIGLALGAAAVARIADRLRGRYAIEGLVVLLTGAAVAAYATLLLFDELPYQFARTYYDVRGSNVLIFALKFGIAFAVMLPPTLLLGGVFPLVMRACAGSLARLGRSVGVVYSCNTLGTILGSFLAGFALIPLLGIQGSLLLAIVLDLGLAALLVAAPTRAVRELTAWPFARRLAGVAALALLGGSLVAAAPAWDTLIMNSGVYQYADDMEEQDVTPEGFRRFMAEDLDVRYYKEGLTTAVMVVQERSTSAILLAVNGKVDASSMGDLPTQLLSGHLPMLLAREPRRALVIGYASGITVGAITLHPVEEVTAVEIEGAVLEASRWFDPFNHRPQENPKVRVVRNDGRNFLLVNDESYDVIVSEPSNPWMTVASNLFTKEFFELGRSRLRPGGVFTQWLQLYGMSPEDLQSLMRTFSSVFPHVLVFNTIEDADLVLIGSAEALGFDLAAIEKRMSDLPVAVDLRRIAVASPADLLTYFVFGTDELHDFLGDGPLNTDDNALIEFRAPKSLHYETRGANMAQVRRVMVDPTRYVAPVEEPDRRRARAIDLARAFLRRRMKERARAVLEATPGLPDTEEGRAVLLEIDTGRAAR